MEIKTVFFNALTNEVDPEGRVKLAKTASNGVDRIIKMCYACDKLVRARTGKNRLNKRKTDRRRGMKRAINAFVLFTIAIVFGGCARVVYKSERASASGFTMTVSGFSMSPETAIGAMAEAEVRQSEAHIIRQCADDPKKCWNWGFGGGLDIPAGYTIAGIQAVGAQTAAVPVGSDTGRKLDEIAREVDVVKKGLKKFFHETGKKAKRASKRR